MGFVVKGKYDESSKSIVDNWISKVLLPQKTINTKRTGYGLKHVLQADTGVYLYTEEFKRAMLANGFESKPAEYSFGENDYNFNVKTRLQQYHGIKVDSSFNIGG